MLLQFSIKELHGQTSNVVVRHIQDFNDPMTGNNIGFGAIGDGVTIDEEAFINAALFFNNLKQDGSGLPEMNVDYANGQTGELILDYRNGRNSTPCNLLIPILVR